MRRSIPFPFLRRRNALKLVGLAFTVPYIGPRLGEWGNAGIELVTQSLPKSPDMSLADGQVANGPQELVVAASGRAEWLAFRDRFITADGRVIDTANGGISHSEGQGWGLLFAEAFDDPDTFNRIYRWTESHLRQPDMALHIWRYDPTAANPTADRNNATDGDITIAAALSRAGRRWHRPELIEAASAIAHDIDRLLTRQVGRRMVLLPGRRGFETKDAVIVNPSYYAFGELAEIGALVSGERFSRIQTDGLALISEGRFGRWRLPPDWLSISRRDGSLSPASSWPPRFSYDAIRILLHLGQSGLDVPGLRDSVATYWNERGAFHPAWVDLVTGEIAPYPAPPGIEAVTDFFLHPVDAPAAGPAGEGTQPVGFPVIGAQTDYYSAALIVLTHLSWRARQGQHEMGQRQ